MILVHRNLRNKSVCFISTLYNDAYQLRELIVAPFEELFQISNEGVRERGTTSPLVYLRFPTRFELL
jgi:hypothetical protein